MFNSFMSPSSSPCPSPVRDLANSIKRVSSPRRNKYKNFVSSQDPIISKGRMTMNGGFSDFRPISYLEKEDSVESTNSSTSSYRSDSCDSGDAILGPENLNRQRFVKIPKRAFVSAVGHLSPRLSKKLTKAMENEKAVELPKNPVWPSVMTTYGRGVSSSPVQTIMMPLEPSLTAMKAQAILDERRDIRIALQMLSYKASLQRQVETNTKDSPEDTEESSSEEESSEEEEEEEEEGRHTTEPKIQENFENQQKINFPNPKTTGNFENQQKINLPNSKTFPAIPKTTENFKNQQKINLPNAESFPINPKTTGNFKNQQEFNNKLQINENQLQINVPNAEPFTINPEINIHTTDDRVQTPESLNYQDHFLDESLFEALDLNSLPTLTPEDLVRSPVAEVRNVHLVSDYIVLETGPPTESVFV